MEERFGWSPVINFGSNFWRGTQGRRGAGASTESGSCSKGGISRGITLHPSQNSLGGSEPKSRWTCTSFQESL